MQAVQVHAYGSPDALRLGDVSRPEPGPGEARVQVVAAGVNFIDIYRRSGQYTGTLPLIVGDEAAGVVDAVGSGVHEVRAGDRVAYAMHTGSYAEYAVVPAWKLAPVPPGVDLRAAAAVMLQGMTAHYLTYSTFPLKPGDTAVIHAAAGGVGLLLTQLAKRRGARVIATVGSEAKAELARNAGADTVINYREADFSAIARQITNGRGVDVVYDSVGRDTFEQGLLCLRPRGMMVLFGQSSGAVAPLDPQTLNARGSLFLTRPSLAHYTLDRAEILRRSGDLFDLIGSGKLSIRIDRSYALADAADAHRAIESRVTTGKVLLDVGA